MTEHYSLQWFGIKAEGLITVLFAMGALLHFTNVAYPIGIAAMTTSMVFVVVDIIITLENKTKKMKRGF